MPTSQMSTPEAIVNDEFPENDLDALCLGVVITHSIAAALDPSYDPDSDEDADPSLLADAYAVLARFIEDGIIRRSDFRYSEHRANHLVRT